jgi:hypothetical protein
MKFMAGMQAANLKSKVVCIAMMNPFFNTLYPHNRKHRSKRFLPSNPHIRLHLVN